MTKQDDWNYKESVLIEPCCCRYECGNYVLSVKGRMTHFKGVPPDEFIDSITFSISDMFDLHRQLVEILDVECQRMDLEQLIQNQNNKEENL